MFTLLRDDVTESPAPHVALPGNMKGGEQEDLPRPREQTAAHSGLKKRVESSLYSIMAEGDKGKLFA